MGKLIAQVVAILIFVNALASSAAAMFTTLAVDYPGLTKYAAIATAVAAFISPFLPRIQSLGQTLKSFGE